jgi:hypothetical protein
MISGTLKSGGASSQISGKLNGDQISFSAGSAQYTGRVSGNAMELSSGGNKLNATRGK